MSITGEQLRAPFPWFGGKRRAAALIWDRLGDVANFVDPFMGSAAVLLARPSEPRIETVNDADALLANFWRAVQQAPDEVATHADWPVNEADLHARHLWLVRRKPEIRAACMADPDWCDPKAAGWWVWGLSQWIGSGWCDDKALTLQAPRCNGLGGQGIHGAKVPNKMPKVGLNGVGVSSLSGVHGEGMAQASTHGSPPCSTACAGCGSAAATGSVSPAIASSWATG